MSRKQVSLLLAQQSGDAPSRKAITGSSKFVTNAPPPPPPAAANSAIASSTPSPAADAAEGSSRAAGGTGGVGVAGPNAAPGAASEYSGDDADEEGK
jgi:hypothetical protein